MKNFVEMAIMYVVVAAIADRWGFWPSVGVVAAYLILVPYARGMIEAHRADRRKGPPQ